MKLIKKYIYFLLIIPTLFFVKTNVYADDPNEYCSAYIDNLNSSSRFYGIDTNFCNNNARYKYNTYSATNYRFINVYGVDFKLGYTLIGNSNYDQTPYDYYVLLYNFRYDIYSYLLSKTESNNFPALNNSYEPRISFSKYSFDFSNQNNQARYVTFENSKQNIYAFWGYPTGFNDVSSYCILESNMSGVSFNNQNVSSCTEEQLPPNFHLEPHNDPIINDSDVNDIGTTIISYLGNIVSTISGNKYVLIIISSLIIAFFILLIKKMVRR